jgi:hypothetical protein
MSSSSSFLNFSFRLVSSCMMAVDSLGLRSSLTVVLLEVKDAIAVVTALSNGKDTRAGY